MINEQSKYRVRTIRLNRGGWYAEVLCRKTGKVLYTTEQNATERSAKIAACYWIEDQIFIQQCSEGNP